jgi:hypothetical protein
MMKATIALIQIAEVLDQFIEFSPASTKLLDHPAAGELQELPGRNGHHYGGQNTADHFFF